MNRPPLHCRSVVACTLIVLGLCSIAEAQPQRRGRRPNIPLLLSSMTEVQQELRMAREQVLFLEALQRDLTAQFRNRGDRERAVTTDAKLFATILDRRQVHRFDEIRLQFEGLRAFDREEIRTSLEVSDEQVRRIRELSRGGPFDVPIEEQLQEVLSDSQLSKWTEMSGREFEFSPSTEQLRQFMRRMRSFEGRRRRGGDRGEPPSRSDSQDKPERSDDARDEGEDDPSDDESQGGSDDEDSP